MPACICSHRLLIAFCNQAPRSQCWSGSPTCTAAAPVCLCCRLGLAAQPQLNPPLEASRCDNKKGIAGTVHTALSVPPTKLPNFQPASLQIITGNSRVPTEYMLKLSEY